MNNLYKGYIGRLSVVFTLFVALIATGQLKAQPGEPARGFEEVADNLYRVQNNNHYTMVLITDEGAIITDPINREFSTWLKEELDDRFNAEVKYVLYSHHHWDHASGGAVFEDTAQFVGHQNMLTNLAMPSADTPLPANAVRMDANGDGVLARSETSGNFQNNFALYDADGDGIINGAEASRGPVVDVRAPDLTYRDNMTISLGGQSVEAIYAGDMTHSNDMSVVLFPEQDTIFMVDWISLGRVPFGTLGSGKLEAWLNAIRFVEVLDYDIAAGGHGIIGDKADVTAVRHYLEELRDLVSAALAEGQSLEQMQATILMEKYSSWINYDTWVSQNVQGMYNILSNQ